MTTPTSRSGPALAAMLLCCLAMPTRAQTPPAAPILSPTPRFVEKTGEEIYANVCRACHMSDAKGAAGAAVYPSLAGNAKLAAGGYPVSVIVNGLKGMPSFGGMMSDEQIAAIVNYVRTQFGNSYADAVKVEDVANARR